MKATSFIVIILFFIVGCTNLPHKKLLIIPKQDYRLDKKTLKSNGYFYAEKETESYCRKTLNKTNNLWSNDSSSRFMRKYISSFMLFSDGYAYYTGGLITPGIPYVTWPLDTNFCYLLTENTYANAMKNFERDLVSGYCIGKHPRQDRGVFQIKNDSIKFQIYLSGNEMPILSEYEGKILNDTTFIINSVKYFEREYSNRTTLVLKKDTFHFKAYHQKVDSTCYIRDNRTIFSKQ